MLLTSRNISDQAFVDVLRHRIARRKITAALFILLGVSLFAVTIYCGFESKRGVEAFIFTLIDSNSVSDSDAVDAMNTVSLNAGLIIGAAAASALLIGALLLFLGLNLIFGRRAEHLLVKSYRSQK